MREELKPIPQNFREKKVSPKETKKQRAIKTAYTRLEEMGFLEYSPKGEIIVNIKKIRSDLNIKTASKLGLAFNSKWIGKENLTQTILALFENSKVISKEDYEKGVRKTKPLFYFPANAEDALDVEKIKRADFYLTLKDKVSQFSCIKEYGNIPKEELSAKEIDLALRIYHPDFGDGYRDPKTGILYIKNKKEEFKKISANLLEELFGTYGEPGKKGGSLYAGRLFIETQTPHLKETGLLIPEDFRIVSGSSTAEKFRVENRKMRQRGEVMLNGVEHILGTKYEGKEIVQISQNIGGILEEDEQKRKKLIATFNIFSKENACKTEKGYFMAGVKKTDPKPFENENFYRKFPRESLDDFKKRIKSYESFEYILGISNDVSHQTGINLVNFDFKQQQLAATLAKEMGNESFIKFVKEYGQDGLRACSTLELGKNVARTVIKISDQRDADKQFAARLVFRKYNSIINETEKIKDFLDRNFSDETSYSLKVIDGIAEKILNKGKNILESFSERIESSSVDEIANTLDSIETGTAVFFAFLRVVKESGKEIDFEMISNLDLSVIGFEDRFNMSKQEIMNLAVECRLNENKRKDEITSKVAMQDLKRALDEKESGKAERKKHKFYTLSCQGSPIAFLRFEKMKDGSLYAGSLSLHKDIQGLEGGHFINESLLHESRGNDIKAIVGIDKKTLPFYTANLGFEIDGYIENYKNSGESFFTISLPRKNNPGRTEKEKSKYKLLAKQAHRMEEIDSLIKKKEDRITLRIPENRLQEVMRKFLSARNDDFKKREGAQGNYKITWYSRIGKERILIFEKI